jgi:hypothetical protein
MNLNAILQLLANLKHEKSEIHDRLLESQMTLSRVYITDDEKILALRAMQQGLNELRALDSRFIELDAQVKYVDGKMRAQRSHPGDSTRYR